MAAMKSRRSVGAGRSTASKPLPRIAAIQQLYEPGPQRNEASSRGARSSPWAASAVLIAGALVAGATFAGGALVDARDRVASAFDHAAADAGFRVTAIHVEGAEGGRRAEVAAAVLAPGRTSLFSAAPIDVKARVERLDWVQRASVARYWPGSVRVRVERRLAVALWDDGRHLAPVDRAGEPIAVMKTNAGLPRVLGAGAGPAAADVLTHLENRPNLRRQLDTLVRVGDRRWDMRLKSGAVIALPADDLEAAFVRLDRAERAWNLLGRPLARIDLRDPTRIAVLPADVLAGGPGLAGAFVPSRAGA